MAKNPFALTKVHRGNNHWTFPQVFVAFIVLLGNFQVLGRAMSAYYAVNYNLMGGWITLLLMVDVTTLYVIRTEEAYYKATMAADFLLRYILRRDTLIKYSNSTSDEKIVRVLKAKNMNQKTGRVTHEACASYKSNQCNTTFHLFLTPQDAQTAADHNENNSLVLDHLRPQTVHKVHVVQCRDIARKSEQYAAKLEDSNAPRAIREENFALMQYFHKLEGQTEWVYAVTVGIGNYADPDEADAAVIQKRDTYVKFLEAAGVTYGIITSRKEYAILYNQMFSMRPRGKLL